jgi:hypothetical protein
LALLAFVVSWRGARDAQRRIAGVASAYQTATEVAAVGATFAIGMFLLAWLVPPALAAGNAVDGFSLARPTDWLALFALTVPFVATGAVIGALHGLALHWLNSWLLKRLLAL